MSRMFIAALFAVCLTSSNATETWWRTFGEIKLGDFTGGLHEAKEGDPKELQAFLEQTRFDE